MDRDERDFKLKQLREREQELESRIDKDGWNISWYFWFFLDLCVAVGLFILLRDVGFLNITMFGNVFAIIIPIWYLGYFPFISRNRLNFHTMLGQTKREKELSKIKKEKREIYNLWSDYDEEEDEED